MVKAPNKLLDGAKELVFAAKKTETWLLVWLYIALFGTHLQSLVQSLCQMVLNLLVGAQHINQAWLQRPLA